jgi:hypothetical protein
VIFPGAIPDSAAPTCFKIFSNFGISSSSFAMATSRNLALRSSLIFSLFLFARIFLYLFALINSLHSSESGSAHSLDNFPACLGDNIGLGSFSVGQFWQVAVAHRPINDRSRLVDDEFIGLENRDLTQWQS